MKIEDSSAVLVERVLFFPIGIENKTTYDKGKSSKEQECKSIMVHFYSSLSITNPAAKEISVMQKQTKIFRTETSCGMTRGETTATVKTILAESKKNLAKFFLCDFVSFTRRQCNSSFCDCQALVKSRMRPNHRLSCGKRALRAASAALVISLGMVGFLPAITMGPNMSTTRST